MWADDLAAACEAAWGSVIHQSPDGHPAAGWLWDRGVPLPASGVGLGILPDLPYPPSFISWAERERWTESAILVVRGWTGGVMSFQVRHPEHKNYLKFEVYEGSTAPQLWGADRALAHVWATSHLVIAEGPFDALACRLAGAGAPVATLGAMASRLTLRWVQRLAKRVTVLYDMDPAGRQAAGRLARTLGGAGVLVSTPVYAAHDPWDLWRSRPAALQALVR